MTRNRSGRCGSKSWKSAAGMAFWSRVVPVEKAQARDGFFIAESSTDPAYRAYYRDIQKLRDFHALAHHPDLLRIRSVIFGDEVMTHPLVILRTIFPNAIEHTTPPHQEYYFIHGSKQTWTAWIPLGDCSRALGSLTLWPGSHKKGFLPVVASKGAGSHPGGVSGGTHLGGSGLQLRRLCHLSLFHGAQGPAEHNRERLCAFPWIVGHSRGGIRSLLPCHWTTPISIRWIGTESTKIGRLTTPCATTGKTTPLPWRKMRHLLSERRRIHTP